VYQQARLFDDVLGHVSAYYVDSIGETDLYDRATRGMLEQLKDPYSVLLTGDDYKALTEQTSGNYAGLGIQIDVRDGWITVVAPLPDTPAERAGVATGDQIIEVDGRSTEGWKNDEAVKALRGEAGTKVTITVRRSGVPDPIRYNLARAQIHIRSVPPGTMFDAGVGYISLNPVAETSADELQSEIGAMKQKGMKSLILDLSPEIGRARQVAAGKRLDRLDAESLDFHQRVLEYYRSVRGEGIRHLDGTLPPDRLLREAWEAVLAADPERFGAAAG
jgi:carboxyl-terminal processing protease